MMPNLKSQRGNPSQTSERAYKEFQLANSKALEYLLLFLQDVKTILPPHAYSEADSSLDAETIVTRFAAEGLSFATLTLPKLSAGLFLYFETGQVCYPSFKIKRGTVHPEFLSGLFRLACRVGEYQVEAISYIYQISVMFKKLKGPYLDSVLSKQLADFVRVDKELADIDLFSDVNFPILERAREEVRRLFSGFSLDSVNVKPRPGPGATNTPVAKHMRFSPHVLYTQVDNVMPYVDFFVVNPWDVVHQTGHYQRLYLNAIKEQRARLKYVHKVVGKARGICIEQNEVQYMQQAIKRAIYDWIQKNPLTKGRINFDDQSINAELALLSSLNALFATIDMSEASDRIWRLLVSWLFQDTVLHDVLMGLSTKWIDLPKNLCTDGPRSILTEKYAPMGSGLCFPVMSVVHWALIRSMIFCSVFDDAAVEQVYVYGDDIILPTELTEMVFTYLPRFGMKLNMTKSYYKSKFRESCGIHAYNGKEITPIFIKNLPVTTSLKEAMSCIAVEYQLVRKGYYGCAHLLRTQLREKFEYNFPIVPVGSSLFGFIRDDVSFPVFSKPPRRKIDSWGNLVYRVRVVTPISESALPPTEGECYLRHVLTNDVKREVSGIPDDFRVKWKYTAAPELHLKSVDDCLKPFVNITDQRCKRDIQQEQEYEFPTNEERRRTLRRLGYRVRRYLPPNTCVNPREVSFEHFSLRGHRYYGNRSCTGSPCPNRCGRKNIPRR